MRVDRRHRGRCRCEPPIDPVRIERLELTADLHEALRRRRPLEAGPPRDIAVPAFFPSAAIGNAIQIAAVDNVQLLTQGPLGGRCKAPLRIADERVVTAPVERVQPAFRIFVELRVTANERKSQRLARGRSK